MTNTAASKEFGGFAILRTMKRRALYFLIPVFILAPAAYYYAGSLPQRYRAKALVGSESQLPGLPAVGDRVDPSTVNAQEQLRAVREVLLTPDVLDSVARQFKVGPNPAPGIGAWIPWPALREWVVSRQDPPAADKPPSPGDELKSEIQIQVDGPSTFYIGYEGADPNLVAQVTNRLAVLFVQRTSKLQVELVDKQDDVLDAEVQKTKNQLDSTEDALKQYKEREAQELPERVSSNLRQVEDLQQQIQSQTDKITDAEARRASIREELAALEKQGALQDEPPPKTAAQTALDEKRLKLSELKARYTPEYPEVVKLEKEIRDLEAQPQPPAPPRKPSDAKMRYVSLQAELSSIDPKVQSYRKDRDALTAQMKDYERRINSAPGYEASVTQQTRDAAMLRTRYEALFAKQQEAKIKQRTERTSSVAAYKILEPAQAPTSPYSPHRGRILLVGLVAGLALGGGWVFLAESLDTTFETVEAVENFSSLPVLAAIPAIPTRVSRKARVKKNRRPLSLSHETGTQDRFSPEQVRHLQKNRVPVLSDPHSIAAQQYGILSLKIERRMRQHEGQMLVVTSATGEEGKSVTALNLAAALAATSRGRVLLVDCDLRLPQMHRRLKLGSIPGLSDFLAGPDYDIAPYISSAGNLDVITGGFEADNPTNLISSPKAREAFSRLRQEYDFVVLDSPPLIPIADGHVLADLSDGVLLVVRARRTRPKLFQSAIESAGPEKIVGVVLNGVEFAGTPYAYAYRHYERHYMSRS
ncbi:MAG TPA: AAA family ATPase [Bryobacteraceae bacterium]